MVSAAAVAASLVLSVSARPIIVDDTPGYGLQFDGIGAISGGGATSRLLFDYDPEIASDILDYLFKPGFGLSLQMLKVEIGGDTDSTEGAEPSHMHFRGDANYRRGYEWWLMKEARKRNPAVKLYGMSWGWPGWLDPAASADHKAANTFANATETANYTLQWLLGARRVHGLDIDYVGQWNENEAPAEYATFLRQFVKDHHLKTNVVDKMVHYGGSGTLDPLTPNAGLRHGSNRMGNGNEPDPNSCDTAPWNETNRGWVDEEGSTFDDEIEYQRGGYQQSARCLARVVNRAYVNQCRTATIQWYLIDSFYSYLPWRHCGVGIANEPWSGHYEIRTPLWALAHTTMFSEAGWRYLRHENGVGALPHGGSYVTRASPNGEDWSMVIEKMSSENSSCTRGSNPYHKTDIETVTFQVRGDLAKKRHLAVWSSDLNQSDAASSDMFKKRFDLELAEDGTFELTIDVNEIITVTTLQIGEKGNHESPPATPFPTTYFDDFEHSHVHSPPRYWYDQMGAWEVQQESNGNKVMRQVSTVWPNCWGYSCDGPTSYFGPERLLDTKVSIDVLLEDDAQWRMNDLRINTDGTWYFGDNAALGGSGASFEKNVWHNVTYLQSGNTVEVSIDGKSLVTAANPSLDLHRTKDMNKPDGDGKAGLKVKLNRYVNAMMDNLKIEPAGNSGASLARHSFLSRHL